MGVNLANTKQMSLRLDIGLTEDLAFVARVLRVDMAPLIHQCIARQLPTLYEEAIALDARMNVLRRQAAADSPRVGEILVALDGVLEEEGAGMEVGHPDFDEFLLDTITAEATRLRQSGDPPLAELINATFKKWWIRWSDARERRKVEDAIQRAAAKK